LPIRADETGNKEAGMEQTHYIVRVQRTTTEYYDYEVSFNLSFFPEYEEAEIAAVDDVKCLDESNQIDWVGQEREYEMVDIQDVVLEFDVALGNSRFIPVGNGRDKEE